MKEYKTGYKPKKSTVKSHLSLLALAVTFLFSCTNLDLPSDGRLTLEDIFSSYQLTRNYYGTCRSRMPQVGFTYGATDTPLASFSDEAHDASDGRSGAVSDWYNNRTSPYSNPLTYSYMDPWNHYFEGIRKCNTFLACINDPSMSTYNFVEEEKNGWIAEVRVMRAFYYLQLIKRYGGVPLMETPDEVTHDFSQDSRATFEECADFIIADCDAALATPETEGRTIGFRWAITDNERGMLTRGVAWAIKSQTALYAASPLWNTADSKYTWERATTITKEALDQCLAHGYQLYDTPVAEDIAQNSYAYYFIQRSDPSRSVDRETIYESTSWRTNVWRNAGTPITEGMAKAGAGPSQELVDAYEMADGTQPVLGYSDANHLQPIVNPASSYDPANPYVGRDPRFYASIYYNNSPRALSGSITKEIIPLDFTSTINNIAVTRNGDEITLESTGGDPWIHTTTLGKPLPSGSTRIVAFEYKSNRANGGGEFFFCVAGGPQGGVELPINIPAASEWTRFEYDLTQAINTWGFGVNANGGAQPENHFLRFDVDANTGYEITVRNFQIEVFTPPPAPTPVETFVGGNCEISDRVTDIRFTRTGYYLRKFNNYRSNPTVDADGLMKIFRLGELYLNFAEAAYHVNGADAAVTSGGSPLSAREAVNIVRARASMPPLPAGLSAEAFEQRYRNERRIELAFEEHRFFDVRRWKILNETDAFVTGMRITKEDEDKYTYTRIKLQTRNTNGDKYLMYPIPQSEVTKMEAFTGQSWQNPGW
ncbi:MAG: RagB/SusD family nutrient uptake outer membrane protein [Bacteroidales bacterium]|nr:RagB/SusD family nutrient uptake outer membrane protein [Bacteroidales bacterium]